MEQDIDQLKTALKRMLSRVPNSVNAGGYQYAVRYKADAAKAQKELAKSRPSAKALKDAFNQLATYY